MFDPKSASEQDSFGFDFTDLLAAGETVVSAVCSVEVLYGTDPNPENMLISAEAIATPWVYQTIGGGIPGNIYCIKCLATTSNSLQKELRGDLKITDAC